MKLNLEAMSREDKLIALQAIWEDLVRDDDQMESPAWHRAALQDTAARVRAGAERVHDWEAAKTELRSRVQ